MIEKNIDWRTKELSVSASELKDLYKSHGSNNVVYITSLFSTCHLKSISVILTAQQANGTIKEIFTSFSIIKDYLMKKFLHFGLMKKNYRPLMISGGP